MTSGDAEPKSTREQALPLSPGSEIDQYINQLITQSIKQAIGQSGNQVITISQYLPSYLSLVRRPID